MAVLVLCNSTGADVLLPRRPTCHNSTPRRRVPHAMRGDAQSAMRVVQSLDRDAGELSRLRLLSRRRAQRGAGHADPGNARPPPCSILERTRTVLFLLSRLSYITVPRYRGSLVYRVYLGYFCVPGTLTFVHAYSTVPEHARISDLTLRSKAGASHSCSVS